MLRKAIALGLILSLYVLSLPGCSSFFTKIDRDKLKVSGKKKGEIQLMLIPHGALRSDIYTQVKRRIRESIQEKDLSDQKLETACAFSEHTGAGIAPAVIATPLIVAGAKLAFDLYMDAKIKEIEALKKAAQVSYSETIAESEKDLGEYGCILLVRPGEKNAPKLVVLLHINKIHNYAFQIKPGYVLAREAVAVTKEDVDVSKGMTPAINMSFAISVKALGRTQSGVNSIIPVGEGAISVSDIKIGSTAKAITCQAPQRVCPTSELIAYPIFPPWSVTVGITETGLVGIDFDQATAELKAIKEAIGPAIKSSLEKALQ